jgi:hypothetical protein
MRRLGGFVGLARRLRLRRRICVGDGRGVDFGRQKSGGQKCDYEANGRHRHGPFYRSAPRRRFRSSFFGLQD